MSRLGAAPLALLVFLLFLLTGTLYLATVSRTYGFIDTGELAAVAVTLGIAHPTGYPTFTLLGYVAVRLVPWARPIVVLNALAAISTAAAVALLSVVIADVLRAASKRKLDLELSFYSFLGAAFLGLTTTWWSQATSYEVYSLHGVFLGLVVLTFLRYVRDLDARKEKFGFTRWGLLFSFAVGLSFTNHLSTVMLGPALLHGFLRATGLRLRAVRELAALVPGAVMGLLPYAYLPLRASMHPPLNWGSPDTFDRFVEHVSGAQFHFAVGFDSRVFRQQLEYLANVLWSDLTFVGILVAALGLTFLFRKARAHALWTWILFLTCAVVSGLYDINDIGDYSLPAYLALGVWVAAGLCYLSSVAGRFTRTGAMALGVSLVVLNALRHFEPMNERENTLVEDLVRNVLADLPPDAVVLSNHWDYWVSGSLYAQHVEGFRPDVVILDPEGLRSETYLRELERHRPELMKPVRNEVEEFLPHVRRLRAGATMTPAEADAYHRAYYTMVSALLERNPARPFFAPNGRTPESETATPAYRGSSPISLRKTPATASRSSRSSTSAPGPTGSTPTSSRSRRSTPRASSPGRGTRRTTDGPTSRGGTGYSHSASIPASPKRKCLISRSTSRTRFVKSCGTTETSVRECKPPKTLRGNGRKGFFALRANMLRSPIGVTNLGRIRQHP
jgi:hypothetical protein